MIEQLVIALTGVLAAWVNQDLNGRVRRWGCVIGLLGQPFWFYATFTASQWGMFAVTVGYTLAFLRGLKNFKQAGLSNG